MVMGAAREGKPLLGARRCLSSSQIGEEAHSRRPVKSILRIAVVAASFPIAYFATRFAESFTGVPLGNGVKEGLLYLN